MTTLRATTHQHNLLSSETLEDPARYMGLLLAPAEGFGQGFFCLLSFWPKKKKKRLMLFVLIFGHLWCSVVTSIIFSSNLRNFEKNPKM